MARAVFHDPENTAGRLVRLLRHDLRDQAIKGGDASGGFTTTESDRLSRRSRDRVETTNCDGATGGSHRPPAGAKRSCR
jgi:hypothetical protein